MNDVEGWIYAEGAAPESVRPLLDALREVMSPSPTADDEARALAGLLAAVDARLAGGGVGAAPAAEAERAPDQGEPRAGFEAWADLSIRLLGAEPEDTRALLAAHGLTPEAWERIDDHHLRALSDDLLAGRHERPALYKARFDEEMARRAASPVSAAPIAGAPVAPPLPAYVPAPAALRGTAEAVDLPAIVRAKLGKLPFKPAEEAAIAPAKSLAKTMQALVTPSLGGTLPLGDNTVQKAVAAMPFAGSAPTASVSFPSLTAREYVSLGGALASRPTARAETLRDYGVPHEASLRALDAHWQAQLAARPELRAELEAAVADFTGWLRGVTR